MTATHSLTFPMLAAMATTILAGCSSHLSRSADDAILPSPDAMHTVETPPPMAVNIPLVAMDGITKVYEVGRYMDPHDSRIMHEQHLLYRREVDPVFALSVPHQQKALIGPTITDHQGNYAPAALDAEIAGELMIQKDMTLAVVQRSGELIDATRRMQERTEELTQRLEKANEAIRLQQDAIRVLENELRSRNPLLETAEPLSPSPRSSATTQPSSPIEPEGGLG